VIQVLFENILDMMEQDLPPFFAPKIASCVSPISKEVTG
jgi:hypothetical protein